MPTPQPQTKITNICYPAMRHNNAQSQRYPQRYSHRGSQQQRPRVYEYNHGMSPDRRIENEQSTRLNNLRRFENTSSASQPSGNTKQNARAMSPSKHIATDPLTAKGAKARPQASQPTEHQTVKEPQALEGVLQMRQSPSKPELMKRAPQAVKGPQTMETQLPSEPELVSRSPLSSQSSTTTDTQTVEAPQVEPPKCHQVKSQAIKTNDAKKSDGQKTNRKETKKNNEQEQPIPTPFLDQGRKIKAPDRIPKRKSSKKKKKKRTA